MEKHANIVNQVLAIDAIHRYPGVSEGLESLSNLTRKSWDYSSPTFEMRPFTGTVLGTAYNEVKFASVEEFKLDFYSRYPYLANIPMDGLLIAGGSVGQFVLKKGREPMWTASDVDVFVYGQKSVEAATALVVKFIDNVDVACKTFAANEVLKRLRERLIEIQRMSANQPTNLMYLTATRVLQKLFSKPIELDKYSIRKPADIGEEDWQITKEMAGSVYFAAMSSSVDAMRSEGTLTMSLHGTKIQIIFRLYSSISEILHGFDLGPSAVGFDGKNVWFTGLGKFAYEYGLSIVDVTRRSPTYEQRLEKYMKRGFKLIAPLLDTAPIERSTAAKYRVAGVLDLPHMPMMFTEIGGNRITVDNFLRGGRDASDYGPEGEFCEVDNWGNEYKAAYVNIHRLLTGKINFIHVETDVPLDKVAEIFTKPPHLTTDMITALYSKLRGSVWQQGRLNLAVLRKYVPCADLKKLTDCSIDETKMRVELDRVFEEQKIAAIMSWTKIESSGQVHSVPWITENPGKQGFLTSSRTPIATTSKEWYGDYYKTGGD